MPTAAPPTHAAGSAKRAADDAPETEASVSKKLRTESEGAEIADRAKSLFTREFEWDTALLCLSSERVFTRRLARVCVCECVALLPRDRAVVAVRRESHRAC
jgi:hypothetical protein